MGDGRRVYPVSARLNIKDIESLELSEDEVAEVFLLPADWLKENLEKNGLRCVLTHIPVPRLTEDLDQVIAALKEYMRRFV